MSKNLVDAQIENNRLKEEHEQELFSLNNEIILLKQTVAETAAQRVRTVQDSAGQKEQVKILEADYKELADQFIAQKSNNVTLGRQLKDEVLFYTLIIYI